jgi:hypothetical protein
MKGSNGFALTVQKVRAGQLSVTQEAAAMIAYVEGVADVDTLQECKAQAAMIQEYLRHKQDLSVEEHNAAVKVWARVQHRLGEVLAETVGRGGDRKSNGHCDRLIPTELGDTDHQRQNASKRAQALAEIPWVEIEQRIDGAEYKVYLGPVVRKIRGDQVRAAAAARGRALPEGPILTGDCFQVLDGRFDASVGLMMADPAYNVKSIKSYGDLARLAARVLYPGGSLITYAGHYALSAIFAAVRKAVGKALRHWWTLCLPHQGSSARQPGRGVYVGWKPLLWFTKGPRRDLSFISDVLPTNIPDKCLHKWQQGDTEAEYLIERLTAPDDLVLDPMCGSGTAVAAALRLGRRGLGVEIDPDRANVARGRVHAATGTPTNGTPAGTPQGRPAEPRRRTL